MTSFGYDNFGRVKETDFPSGKAETYTYDEIGNLLEKTDRNGNAITYVYDALNRLTHKGYPDGTGTDYIYDLVGKIKQATDPTGTYGFAYDNMGRSIGTTTQYAFLPGNTYTNAYQYDAASNRAAFTAPDGSSNTYVYDSLNRLNTLTNSLTGQFGFGYDALSRRTSLTRPNSVSTSYSYDNLSRLLSVLHQTGATTVDGASYTLDNAGNRTSKLNQFNGVSENYTYDPIYQLTQVQQIVNGTQSTTETYSYDAAGNRLSSLNVASYSYNNSNQVTSSSDGYSYTYDANGNTLTKANSVGTTSYGWDFENRLTSVTLPNGGGTASYRYDPFGRRVQKSSPNGITNYVYDVSNLLEEVDQSGNVLAKYTAGPRIDQPLAMLRGSSTTFYSADGLGSITSLTNAAAALAQSYTYDAFGKLTALNGSITNPLQYTGREFDSETGLLYLRNRYVDSTTGRFVSEDPIRFKAGVNFYDYVLNNPVLHVDPFGLETGNLNNTVSGPNGETAGNKPCPECLKNTMHQLEQDLGKPGCVLKCGIIWGPFDDIAIGSVALLSKTVRAALMSATGKIVLKTAGICGAVGTVVYCSYHCDVLNPPKPSKPGFNPYDPYLQYALTH
jgi:RHS repeat-associated protein